MSIGVYALIFPNGKVYIGSTAVSFRVRFHRHMKGLRRGLHSNTYMQRLFNKYGKPEFRVLEKCEDSAKVAIREQAWIDAQNPKMIINCGPAYPSVTFGKHPSIETRKKLSESHKGRISWSTGKHLSEETRKKMSESGKRRIFSEETRRRISESKKGKPSPMKGKHHSIESINKISESNKRRWRTVKGLL